MPIRQSNSVGMNSWASSTDEWRNISSSAARSSSSLATLCMPTENDPSGILRMKGAPRRSLISPKEYSLLRNSSCEAGAGMRAFSKSSQR